MAGSVNKVILVGNLGRDPEVRSFQNGGRVAELRLATSESWKDKNTGERKERTEWHTVKIFTDGLVTVAERYLRKGSKVYIEGSLATRKWQDQSGADRFSTEITLQGFNASLVMLDAPQGGGQRTDTQQDSVGFGDDAGDGWGPGHVLMRRVDTKPRKQNSHRADEWKRCEPFKKWLRGRKCFIATQDRKHVCQGFVRACHFDPWGDKGVGSKVSDSACMPMCDGAHLEQTDVLGWPEFQRKYEFDGRDVVTAYWTEWLDTTPMGRAWQAKQEKAA